MSQATKKGTSVLFCKVKGSWLRISDSFGKLSFHTLVLSNMAYVSISVIQKLWYNSEECHHSPTNKACAIFIQLYKAAMQTDQMR